jgi:hypothetical protein
LPLTALASDEPLYRLLSFSQWLISLWLNRGISLSINLLFAVAALSRRAITPTLTDHQNFSQGLIGLG